MTANGSVNRAVEAMRAGAYDFLVKPFEENRSLSTVKAATDEMLQGTRRDPRPRRRAEPTPRRPARASSGRPRRWQRIHRTIGSVARSMATVFITGESGTGKELAALAVHAPPAAPPAPSSR
jgi:two-component system repressor protein LuxO